MAAFLISFTGHGLLLGTLGFNSGLPWHEKKTEELTVELQIERPALLPKIDNMGPEKKFKDIEQAPRPQSKLQASPEQVTAQEAPQERTDDKVIVTDPDKDAMLRYQDMVKQRIEAARRYPVWAKKQGIEGVTRLYFTVLPNGIGRDIKIVRPSGSSILDGEAVATVKRAGPFPPVPREISGSSIGMEVAIVFSLDKNQKM